MQRLEPESIKKHDLVLVEALVHRWPLLKGQERADFWKHKDWTTWRVEFKLDSLYLLFRASAFVNETRPGENFEV